MEEVRGLTEWSWGVRKRRGTRAQSVGAVCLAASLFMCAACGHGKTSTVTGVSDEKRLQKWVSAARHAHGRYLPCGEETFGALQQYVRVWDDGGAPAIAPTGYAGDAVGPDYLWLREPVAAHGGGAFVLREGVRGPAWIIEVPHSFFDRGTLPVGWHLFAALNARALLVNTVHRYRGAGCPRGAASCVSDMARNAHSAFFAVHRALTETSGGAAREGRMVLAVHGFQRQDGDPDVIVSSAGSHSDVAPIKHALSEALSLHGVSVGAFPDDVARLGGLRTVQGQHLKAIGGRMLHLELSAEVRQRLAEDEALTRAFVVALTAG